MRPRFLRHPFPPQSTLYAPFDSDRAATSPDSVGGDENGANQTAVAVEGPLVAATPGGDVPLEIAPTEAIEGENSASFPTATVASATVSSGGNRMRKVAMQVTGSTGLSALIGITNGLVGARLFGLSRAMDAYLVAVNIPQLLGFIFGIRLSVFLVPWLISLRHIQGARAARAREWQIALLFPAITGVLLGGCYLVGPDMVRWQAPYFTSPQIAEVLSLLKWAVPGGVAIVAMWILTSIAHSHQRFAGASLATIINPAVTLLLLLTLGHRIGVTAIAMGFFLGPLAGCVPILWSLRGTSQTNSQAAGAKAVQEMPHFGLVMLLGLMMTAQNQIPLLVGRRLASGMGEGVIAGLQYATQFSWMPVTILATSVGTALLPSLAKRHQESKAGFDGEALQDAARAMRVLAYLLVPLSFMILFYANPLVNLALAGGRFDKIAGLITSGAMQCYAPLIWVGAIWAILLKVVQARNALRIVFESLLIGTVIDVCGMLLLAHGFGYRAIPLSGSANYLITTAYMLWRTRNEVRLPLRQIGGSMAMLTLLAGAASGISLALSPWTIAPITALVFCSSYIGLARALRVREQEEFWTLVLGPKFRRFLPTAKPATAR